MNAKKAKKARKAVREAMAKMEKPLPEVTYGRGLGPARVSPQSQRGIYLKIKAVARRVKIVRNKAVVTA